MRSDSFRIRLVNHDPAWVQSFETEAARIREVMRGQIVVIHHVGSTAIPGIVAKPIIDMLPEVRDIERVDGCNDAMAQLGYEALGEFGLAGRRYFRKDTNSELSHHVHVFQFGNPEVARHLDFRDYLRAHVDAAHEYERIKRALAECYSDNTERYTEGKTEFIRAVERKAVVWRATLS